MKYKQRYYFRILVFLLLASIIPTVFLVFFIDRETTSLINETYVNSNVKNLELLSETTELIFDNITDTVNLLRMNKDFVDYEYFSDKSYYKNFHRRYDETKVSEYARYLALRKGINDNLEHVTTASEWIQSAYYYDSEMKEVFSVDFIPTHIDKFKYKDWYPQINEIKNITLSGPYKSPSNQNILYLMFPKQINSKSIFIININMDTLYKFLYKKIHPSNIKEFFMLSRGGKPFVYSNKNSKLINSLSWIISNNTKQEGQTDIKLDKESHLISSYYPVYSNLSFHTIDDQFDMNNTLKEKRVYLLIIMLPIIIICIIFVLISRKLLYSPIHQLITHVQDKDVDNVEHLDKWIGDSISDRDKQKNLLDKAVPAYQQFFIQKMMETHDEKRDPNDIISEFKLLDFPFAPDQLRVISCFTEPNNAQSFIYKIFLDWLAMYDKEGFCLIWNKKVYTVIDCSSLKYNRLCNDLDSLIRNVFETKRIRLYCAVSSNPLSIESLNEGVADTEEILLNYIRKPFGTKLRHLRDEISDNTKQFNISSEQIDETINSLKNNNDESLRNILNIQIQEINNYTEKLSYNSVINLYVYWIKSLIYRLNEQGFSLSANSHIIGDFFQSLSNTKTQEALDFLIYNFVKDIKEVITSNCDNPKINKYIITAKRLINEKLSSDISLTSISEDMGISTYYLSRIFKTECNESFSSYLKNRRMILSKSLLDSNDLKIQDISKAVGYWSPNYFIKVFKKHYGITPGEYRQISMKELKDDSLSEYM